MKNIFFKIVSLLLNSLASTITVIILFGTIDGGGHIGINPFSFLVLLLIINNGFSWWQYDKKNYKNSILISFLPILFILLLARAFMISFT